jgi:hypothetical protein
LGPVGPEQTRRRGDALGGQPGAGAGLFDGQLEVIES